MVTFRTMIVTLAAFAVGLPLANADDSVWRSSQPLRIRVAHDAGPVAAAQSVWDRIEYPLLVQKLQSEIDLARSYVGFWELRLENYDRLRFSDATKTAIKHAENSLEASRRHEAAATRKLALVRRHGVALGQLRAQLLQQGQMNSQLDR